MEEDSTKQTKVCAYAYVRACGCKSIAWDTCTDMGQTALHKC